MDWHDDDRHYFMMFIMMVFTVIRPEGYTYKCDGPLSATDRPGWLAFWKAEGKKAFF